MGSIHISQLSEQFEMASNKVLRKFHTEIYRRDFYEMNLSNRQNAGNADKMGIFGVAL